MTALALAALAALLLSAVTATVLVCRALDRRQAWRDDVDGGER